MKKNVAVLMGGYSSEYEISMKSGQVVYNNLDKDLYNAFRIVVTKDKWFYLDNNNKEFNISKNDFSLTIENKKYVNNDLAHKIGNNIYGCDICQEVCPWNRLSEPHSTPEFLPSGHLQLMRKEDWDRLNKPQFKKMFKNSALKRTRYEGLKRNIIFINED